VAALNWASTKTLGHEKLMDDYIDELKLMSDEQLLIEHQGA
jgi:hypothetical protein